MRVGEYELLGEVARGGTGAVWRAKDLRLGRTVALKLLLAPGDARARERLAREAQALARLHHPGIVSVHAVGEHEGRPYLVMDFVPGETLEARLARDGPMKPGSVALLGLSLAQALAHAHAEGVLHRDLKPGNVLLGPGGKPLILDFGLAAAQVGAVTLSPDGAALGTPGFWPPEQMLGQLGRIGPASDLYALGATLYAALTGVPPFEGSRPHAVIATLEQPPPSLAEHGVSAPAELEALVLSCLAKEPSHRPESAAALAAQLEAFLRAGGARSRVWLVALAVAAAASGAALGVTVLSRPDPPAAPAPSTEAVPTSAAPPAPEAPASPEERIPVQGPPVSSNYDGRVAWDGEHLDRRRIATLLDERERAAPGDAGALHRRAVARGLAGRMREALADVDAALALDPSLAAAHTTRAWVLIQLDRRREALQAFADALRIDPVGEARAHLGIAATHASYDELEPCEGALQRALQSVPDDPRTLRNLAALDCAHGRLRKAMERYTELVRRDPGDPWARAGRAWIWLATGEPGRARPELDAMVDDPLLPDCARIRGNLLWAVGDARAAATHLEAYLKWIPLDVETRGMLAFVRFAQGDFAAAEAEYEQVLSSGRARDAYPRVCRGLVRWLRGDDEGAEEDLRRGCEEGYVYAALWLCALRNQQGPLAPFRDVPGWEGALARHLSGELGEGELWQALEAVTPQEVSSRRAIARGLLGARAERLGRPAEALEHYRACLAEGQREVVQSTWSRLRMVALAGE